MAEGKPAPDWERIEADYRAGVLSVREIAASQGITHGAINKRAKRDGWERDLNGKIQAKANALVSKREVSSAVSTDTERQIVEANAEVIAGIRLAHRRDIARSRALCMQLLGELEFTSSNQELFEQLGDLLAGGEDDDEKAQAKRLEVLQKAISAPIRIDGMKKLTDTLKTLLGLEREAYGLATKEGEDDGQVVVEVMHFAG
jgi:hypothetical protein